MTNHFHLLLEVPPPTNGEFGLSEDELIHRPGGLYFCFAISAGSKRRK